MPTCVAVVCVANEYEVFNNKSGPQLPSQSSRQRRESVTGKLHDRTGNINGTGERERGRERFSEEQVPVRMRRLCKSMRLSRMAQLFDLANSGYIQFSAFASLIHLTISCCSPRGQIRIEMTAKEAFNFFYEDISDSVDKQDMLKSSKWWASTRAVSSSFLSVRVM